MYKTQKDTVIDKEGNVIGVEVNNTGAAAIVATIPALFALVSEIRNPKAKSTQREKGLQSDLAWAYSSLEPVCSKWKVRKNGIYNLYGELVFKFSSNARKFAALLRLSIAHLKKWTYSSL